MAPRCDATTYAAVSRGEPLPRVVLQGGGGAPRGALRHNHPPAPALPLRQQAAVAAARSAPPAPARLRALTATLKFVILKKKKSVYCISARGAL